MNLGLDLGPSLSLDLFWLHLGFDLGLGPGLGLIPSKEGDPGLGLGPDLLDLSLNRGCRG